MTGGELISKYIYLWNLQDLDGLKKIFSIDVELIDWEIHAKGISEVIQANKNIFIKDESIKAEIVDVALGEKKAYADLLIKTGQDKINIIDVIDWNDDYKITKIKAYKN